MLSASICSNASADTPRQRYLQNFNYHWDMQSEPPLSQFDAPFYGNFELYEPLSFYECGMFSFSDAECHVKNDISYLAEHFFYSESINDWADGDEPWFTIFPYSLNELYDNRADWAFIPMCNVPFNTLEDGFIISNDGIIPDDDIKEFEAELRVAEQTFTRQFLDHIGADQQLRQQIAQTGLLTYRANEYFRTAWIEGRLERPAITFVVGECGAGGNEVTLAFAEPTTRFQIITDFDYLLCQNMGLDPWNADECTHVRDQLSNLQVLSGRYRAKITRQSGTVLFREIEINEITDSELTL